MPVHKCRQLSQKTGALYRPRRHKKPGAGPGSGRRLLDLGFLVGHVLADDGIFVAQLMLLRDMMEGYDLGNFSHEHLEFYSLRSLRELFGRDEGAVREALGAGDADGGVEGGSQRMNAE